MILSGIGGDDATEEACDVGGMERQTLRDSVIRFNQQGPDGLINVPSPGVPPKLGKKHRAFLVRLVEEGPIPAVHGVVRWRACDLIMRLHEEFGISVSDDTIYRALKDLGFSHVSAAAEGHKQDPDAMAAFEKNFAVRVAEVRAKLAPGTPVEVWFQDEMRVGQKNGAVCPGHGTGGALVLPFCNTEAMQLHLDEIATRVTAGAHAILILDQAGRNGAKDLKIPSNISLLQLPPRAPELNSQENIWQFMRQNWLSNRIFKSFDDIVDCCCYAWNTLIDQPWKIMTIARGDWAVVVQSI